MSGNGQTNGAPRELPEPLPGQAPLSEETGVSAHGSGWSPPVDMRPYYLSQAWVFRVSLRLYLPVLFGFPLGLLAVFLGGIAFYVGAHYLLRPDLWLPQAGTLAGLSAAWILLCLFSIRMKTRTMKALDQDVLFGFDEEAIYSSCDYYTSRITWEYFRSWKELKDCFILADGARQVIFPKAPWNDEECGRVRALLRAKATKESRLVP